jgi:hypothetical protein
MPAIEDWTNVKTIPDNVANRPIQQPTATATEPPGLLSISFCIFVKYSLAGTDCTYYAKSSDVTTDVISQRRYPFKRTTGAQLGRHSPIL